MRTVGVAISLGMVAALVAVSGAATAATAPDHRASHRAVSATLKAPGSAEEGQRLSLRIRVSKPARYKKVLLQHEVADVFGNTSWETFRRFAPKKRLVGRSLAGEEDLQRYRVVLVDKAGRQRVAARAKVRIWHWYPLTGFEAYYSTAGTMSSPYWQFAMNGRQYRGWYTYGSYGSWESRYTVGRNCSSLRGDFGVKDDSDDGSTGAIQVTLDAATAYSSPVLSPGMVDQAQIPLAQTYRLSIMGQDTSATGVRAHPAVGDAELLCTGLE